MGIGFSFGVQKMFWNLMEVVAVHHHEGTKCHLHLKMVNLKLGEFHFSYSNNTLLTANDVGTFVLVKDEMV